MKKILGILAMLVLATSANAQSVQQSGSITPNHVSRWVSNGVIGDGGTAADSPTTTFGVTSNTTAGICVSSGRSTAAGRQQLCMGAPLNAPGVISVQNYGTATPQGLNFVINGVITTIPSSGGDFLTGTGPYVAGGIPCFTGTTAAVHDCGLVASSGTITSGIWQGTAVALGFGGTGASSASGARTNLGLGTIATQAASAVAITGGTITGMPSPSATTDVATKAYVDATSTGLNILAQSTLATAAVLPNTPAYANGASGVGATLTAGSNTTLTVDGTAAPLNTVVLVKNQASTFQNGIYTVTTAGSGAAAWVLTRATYFDQAAEMKAGSYTFITSGSTNPNSSWTLQTAVTTVGTDALTFIQFSQSGNGVTNATIAAGTGITVSGTCAITTFGTCTVGLTNPVSASLGGTGVNNGSNTITLTNSLTGVFTGALTLTTTNTTNATLPAGSHTLAAIDLAQTWTAGQSFNSSSPIVTNSTLAVCSSIISGERLTVCFDGTTQFGQFIRETTGLIGSTFVAFDSIGSIIGGIVVSGASSVAYQTTSDARLKDDLKPLVNVRDKIAALTAYDFRWKGSDTRSKGFMAQEAYKIIPEAVGKGGDDPKTKPWQLDYSKVVPTLWANAQDANARIDALEKEIIMLKSHTRVRFGRLDR